MKLCDVNVLVYAHRQDSSTDHPAYAALVSSMAGGRSAFALSENVLSGFVRVVTSRRIFREPTPVEEALEFCDRLRSRQNAMILRPGPRNWEIFSDLCRKTNAHGKLVADALHAALAIEYDCQWLSSDADFARFPGLDWRHPLAS